MIVLNYTIDEIEQARLDFSHNWFKLDCVKPQSYNVAIDCMNTMIEQLEKEYMTKIIKQLEEETTN